MADESHIVQSIVTSAMGIHDVITADQFSDYVSINCPDLFAGALKWVELQGLAEDAEEAVVWARPRSLPALLNCEGERGLLMTRHTLWLMASIVPEVYRASGSWTLLYNSVLHGHGCNRFFNHVLHYKGPTIVMIRDYEGDMIVALVDSEWHSDHPGSFGGSLCRLMTIIPRMHLYPHAVAVHVDLKTRHKAHGIAIGSDPSFHHAMLWVPSDLQTGIIRFDPTLPPGTARQININTVEVWGCAVPQAMQAQAFQRAREAQAVEQRQKVRNPGDWMDNPDRFLLGLAGISVDNVSRMSTQTR